MARRLAGHGQAIEPDEIDDVADAAQQVFEIQLAFTRQEARQEETRAGQAGEG